MPETHAQVHVQDCEGVDLAALAQREGHRVVGNEPRRGMRPAEVLVDGGRYAVVRRRQSFDEMIAGEQPATDWRHA